MSVEDSPPEIELREALDSVSDAVVAIDAHWRIAYVNRAYMQMVARLFSSSDQLLGRVLWEAFPDITDTEPDRFYRRVMAEQRPDTLELFYEPLKSWLEIRAFPSPNLLSLYVRDISERKQHETELQELTKLLREQAGMFDTVLSNLPDISYAFDREARVIYANQPLLKIWGRTLREVLGRNLFELDYPYDLAVKLTADLRRVAETGLAVSGEVPFQSADGVEDIHDYIFNPIFDTDGNVVGVAGTSRLVTEKRNAEKAMRQLAAIVSSSDDAIISKNLDGVIQSWNEGAARLFGYTAEESIGQSILLLIPEDRHNEEKEILRRVCVGQRVEHFETLRRRKNGTVVPVSLTVSPIRDNTGEVVGASKIARDITEQKAVTAALQEAKEAAEAANRSKDRFLAVLSHELRTPLTPALMVAGALERDSGLPKEYRPDIAMLRRNLELETKLIDDLLDLSRIISGKLVLQRESVDMNALINHVCDICRPQIAEKDLSLVLDLAPALGPVHADSSRLQQVLWNVIKNAAKFTPENGKITIATRAAGEMAEATVEDTGVGIPAESIVKIFEAFEQGDSRVVKQFGGLGLGLAISKVIVELHGGSIVAESGGPGRGSKFTIRLPLDSNIMPAAPTSEPIATSDQNPSLRVLIVEDHPDTAEMLARLLQATGYIAESAGTVAGALELASVNPFDVVVSDVGLPDGSGYELMRHLRKRHGLKGIAMSGYGMEEDVRKSIEAGFSEHLVKPVDFSRLATALRKLTETK